MGRIEYGLQWAKSPPPIPNSPYLGGPGPRIQYNNAWVLSGPHHQKRAVESFSRFCTAQPLDGLKGEGHTLDITPLGE